MTPPRQLAVGLVLTACAGLIDAVGFIELGGFYTSFMSGNTTQLGTELIAGHPQMALLALALIVMFFLGSLAGSLLALRRPWGQALVLGFVIAAIAVSLALSLTGFAAGQAMIVLAAAAGAQNSVLPFSGAARLGATFITGTLHAAGADLAAAMTGNAPRWRWLQHLLVWASLLLGAAVGALLYGVWRILALVVPAAVYAIFLAAFVMGPISGRR